MRLTLLVLISQAFFMACPAPLALEGESCLNAPCASGLVCNEDKLCAEAETPPIPPEPECEDVGDCLIDGSTDGRLCVDGACRFATCDNDDECGRLDCIRGECAPPFFCSEDEECEGGICEEGECVEGCTADSCGQFFSCGSNGRCLQQCLGFDFLCFGNICEEEGCVDPQCEVGEDCVGENLDCEDGRCVTFTPCTNDAACFDANFFCSDEGRCTERPLCLSDRECGVASICIDSHCRDATTCEEGCEGTQECVDDRCVSKPQCRDDSVCDEGQFCIRNRCDFADDIIVDALAVAGPRGMCEADGSGACRVVLFERESIDLFLYAVGSDDELGFADFEFEGQPGLNLSLTGNKLSLIAENDGDYFLTIRAPGGEHTTMNVVVLRDSAEVRRVVVSESNGQPVVGATTVISNITFTSDERGIMVFPTRNLRAIPIVHEGRGLFVIADTDGDMRVFFDQPPTLGQAGVVMTVTSSGDELGAVGTGFVIPSVKRSFDLSLDRLFGDSFAGSAEIPVLGSIPLQLPQGATLSGTLPIIGDVSIKDDAFIALDEGRSIATVYEGRFEQNELFSLAPAGRDGFVERMSEASESSDVATIAIGPKLALPLVTDENDIDGDFNQTERVPDWQSFSRIDAVPERRATERVEVRVGPAPEGANSAQVTAILGLDVAGIGFVTTGFAPLENRRGQVRVQPPQNAAFTKSSRMAFAELEFDDDRVARSFFRGAAFSNLLEMPGFLRPGRTLDIVELQSGVRLTVLDPGESNAFILRVQKAGIDWKIMWADTASVTLPLDLFSRADFTRIETLKVDGLATDSLFRDGTLRSIEERTLAHSIGEITLAEPPE